jgi:peptidoglycan/LPS O-acetylase OafA/YrhL
MSHPPKRDNNFNLLRLIAAWLILFGHSYDLYNHTSDPFVRLLHIPGASFYALACFFTISGYLVTASWLRQPHVIPYALNRMLRILPALIMVVLLSVFILGPIVTSLTLSEYFSHSDTWKYLRTMHIFGLRYSLPGVFDTVPYANVVNGSLWSLKLEVQCYIILALLGVTGLLKPRLMCLCAVMCLIGNAALTHLINNPAAHVLGMKYNNIIQFTLWGFFFWAGSTLRLYKEHVYFSPRSILAVTILSFALYFMIPAYGYYLHALTLPYMILGIALHVPTIMPRLFTKHDISYGIYLYAFPIQQCYMHYVGDSYGIGGFIACATLCTLTASLLSWHLVERTALRLKPSRHKPSLTPAFVAGDT